MKERLKNLIRTKTAIHCETEEEAEKLISVLKELNYTWYSKKSYTNWYNYQENTCYNLNTFDLEYSHIDFFIENGYTIIKFKYLLDKPKEKVIKSEIKLENIDIIEEGFEKCPKCGEFKVGKDSSHESEYFCHNCEMSFNKKEGLYGN